MALLGLGTLVSVTFVRRLAFRVGLLARSLAFELVTLTRFLAFELVTLVGIDPLTFVSLCALLFSFHSAPMLCRARPSVHHGTDMGGWFIENALVPVCAIPP